MSSNAQFFVFLSCNLLQLMEFRDDYDKLAEVLLNKVIFLTFTILFIKVAACSTIGRDAGFRMFPESSHGGAVSNPSWSNLPSH